MKCARANCSCSVDHEARFEYGGKVYCNEQCAAECTDQQCVCSPCGCPK